MVVTSLKAVGRSIVKTHEVDIATSRELREIEKQIAIERGQWIEKQDLKQEIKTVADIPDDVLDALIARGRELQAQQAQRVAQLTAPIDKENVIDAPEREPEQIQ
jgi:hypothetical protein